jgi:TetR/AcrR family transcriptional regulator, acrAB operon repressor
MRRTKEDAARTKTRILDAARLVFRRDGVSRATLDSIAREAGVSKGAIYWHFENKKALFRALRDRVPVPLIDRPNFASLTNPANADALTRVECFLLGFVSLLERDEAARDTLDIMMYRCEYVADLANDLDESLRRFDETRKELQHAYRQAERESVLRPGLPAAIAATETMVFLTGLVRLWLVSKPASPFRRGARSLIVAHVQGRRIR